MVCHNRNQTNFPLLTFGNSKHLLNWFERSSHKVGITHRTSARVVTSGWCHLPCPSRSRTKPSLLCNGNFFERYCLLVDPIPDDRLPGMCHLATWICVRRLGLARPKEACLRICSLVCVFIVDKVLAILCMSQIWWVGPIALKVRNPPYSTDISWELTLGATALLYIPLRWLKR